MQTYNVPDSAHLRYKSLKGDSVQVKVEEDMSDDKEKDHESETVGWLITSGR